VWDEQEGIKKGILKYVRPDLIWPIMPVCLFPSVRLELRGQPDWIDAMSPPSTLQVHLLTLLKS